MQLSCIILKRLANRPYPQKWTTFDHFWARFFKISRVKSGPDGHGYPRLPTAAHGCPRLPTAAHGYPRLARLPTAAAGWPRLATAELGWARLGIRVDIHTSRLQLWEDCTCLYLIGPIPSQVEHIDRLSHSLSSRLLWPTLKVKLTVCRTPARRR